MPDASAADLPDRADVAIVGAGVAGLYCAYRLLLDDPTRRVTVLDLLPRVGGRLDTDLVRLKSLDRFGDDGALIPGGCVTVKEEEGGMRFNAAMPELLSLIDALDLWGRIIPFGMGDDENWFHIRGRSFTAGQSKQDEHAIWATLYDLRPNERNKSPGEIVLAVYRDLVLANGDLPPENPTPEFWQKFRLDFQFQGRPLNQWGLWSLCRAFGLSDECIAMLADTVGFQAPFHGRSSAGVALQLLEDFPLDPQFFALADGFGSLPQALLARVQQLGGTVRLSTGVEGVAREAAGFSIRLAAGGPLGCDRLILTVPPLTLGRLLDASPGLAAEPAGACLRRAIDSVVAHRLCKVNLDHDHAWWRDRLEGRRPQVRNGGSFTTQPLGAVYVFDPLAGEDATGPAALTIYSDFSKTDFWQQLQELGPLFDLPSQREHAGHEPQVLFAASEPLVAEATLQLRDLFRVLAVPRPVLTSYRLWSGEHEFGFAYHQWGRGVDDRAVMAEVASPGDGVFVCNEAFSDDQGWVNGSLRSADRVLGAHFGIGALPPANKLLPGAAAPGATSGALKREVSPVL